MYVLKSNSYIFFTQCHFKMGKNISTVEKRQIVNALLTKMGLDERSTTIVAKLSSGERRRLGLAEEVSRYQVNITPTPTFYQDRCNGPLRLQQSLSLISGLHSSKFANWSASLGKLW